MRSWNLFGGPGAPAPGGTPVAGAAPASAPATPTLGSGIDRPLRGPRSHVLAGNGDPAARLPELAAEKLARLCQADNQAGVLLRDAGERQMRAGDRKRAAEADLARLQRTREGAGRPVTRTSSYMRGGDPMDATPYVVPASDARLREAEAELSAARAALDAVTREIAELTARRSRLPEAIIAWLGRLDARIEPHRDANAGSKAKGRATVAELERLRSRVSDLNAEIAAVRAAPPPVAVVIDRARQQVAAMAEHGRPDYLAAIEGVGPVKFREQLLQMQTATPAGPGVTAHSMPDVLGLFAYVHRDALMQKLEADLTELADDEGTLTDEEKAKREQQLHIEILEAERAEEAIIEELELSGLPVARRDNADPRAVLGIELR